MYYRKCALYIFHKTKNLLVIRRIGAKPDSPISARCAEKHYPVYCTDFRRRHAVASTDLIINYSCRDVACYVRSIIPIFSFFGRCKQRPYNNIIKKMRDARFTGRGTPHTYRTGIHNLYTQPNDKNWVRHASHKPSCRNRLGINTDFSHDALPYICGVKT